MSRREVVIDTSVLVAGVKSRNGASFRLLSMLGVTERFRVHVSVPLVLEYEDVLKRGHPTALADGDVDAIIDYICSVAEHREIYFLWRPFLRDPGDDLVLELAVEAGCDAIVTFNLRDFSGCEQFGVRAVTPGQFLKEIGELR